MTKEKLKEIISRHAAWLRDKDDGARADLCDANLRGANLCDANLRDANLGDANLCGADLRDADLRGANLRCANLRDANLRGANLCGANLRGADLRDANLCDADLGDADLRGANLRGANLRDANLRGADLCGANLRGAVGGNSRIQSLQIHPYRIIVLDKDIAWAGCTKKSVADWLAYDGKRLSESDKTYLETVTKPFLRMVVAHG